MELPELKEDFSNPDRKAIQETSFTKDVLARYQCNTLDEVRAAVATPATDFDAIVVGSGMYGAACAERIYRRGGRVLVLDAGPFVVSEHVQNMADPAFEVAEAENLLGQPCFGEYRSALSPGRKSPINYAGHNYNVGGKSIRWGGWSPRLTEEDLALWPTDMAQYFRDYYREVEFQIGAFPTADFIKGPLADALFARAKAIEGQLDIRAVLPAPIAVQAEQPASGLFSFDKYSSLPVLIEALRGDAKAAIGRSLSSDDSNSRRAIHLVPRCRVLRLETAAAGGGKRRVTALRVYHGGARPVIDLLPVPAGCSVVLAANSMESTRLALESFAEAGPGAGRIGRNFQVHLRTDVTVRIPRASFEADLKRIARKRLEAEQSAKYHCEASDTRPVEVQAEDVLAALQTAALHIQCSDGKRRYHLQLIAVSDPGGNAEALLHRQDTSLPELTGALGSLRSSWIAVKFILVGELMPDRTKPVGSQDTNWANLSESQRDEFVGQGDPGVVSQHYSSRKLYTYVNLSDEDEALWLKMDKTALAVAKELAGPGGRVEYLVGGKWTATPPSDDQLRDTHHSLGSTYHECGTLWMDPVANQGVVDSTGRFLDIENAYCCDQAVFTSSGSANPVPTGLVVAKRVSEAIVPDQPVSESGFTDLFVFDEPKGDYTALPVALGDMPRGWKFIGGGRFTRRGKRVETAGGIGLLYYAARTFRDFTLRLEWRCPMPRGNFNYFNNSGVYLRWPKEVGVAGGQKRTADELTLEEFGTYGIKQGYEIQIDDTGYRPGLEFSGGPEGLNDLAHTTGAVYPAYFATAPGFALPRFNADTAAPRQTGSPASALKSRAAGEWNEYEITIRSGRIVVKLNGETINDATDHENAYPEGFIGLQNHFNGYRVQFRNVRVKEL